MKRYSEAALKKRREYTTGWRARNQERARQYQKEYNKRRTASRRKIIDAAKAKPCKDCGQKYPYYVMDFDHVRGKKIDCVGHMLSQSLARIVKEISKCDVVCSNCHRKRTHRRRRKK